MSIAFKEVNFSKLFDKLSPCCLSEEVCEGCEKEKCLVGYAKECFKNCMINKVAYVIDGYKNIPLTDLKIYEKDFQIDGIVEILKTCKSCNEEHFDNCIINILRSCYEVALIGEEQEYKGSTLLYLSELRERNPIIAEKVFEKYNSKG